MDETGTAGEDQFSLGLVMAFSHDVSKVDKMFSDLMPVGFNEFHANKHDNEFVKTTIASLADRTTNTSLMLFSHYKPDLRVACIPSYHWPLNSVRPVDRAATKRLRFMLAHLYQGDMNNRHRKTLAAVFKDPVSGSIEWADIEKLFVAAGARTIEGRGSRVRFEAGGEVVTFHRPHPAKEAKRYQVRDAREFLERIGVTP